MNTTDTELRQAQIKQLQADVLQTQADTIRTLLDAGWMHGKVPRSSQIIEAVTANDLSLLITEGESPAEPQSDVIETS